MLPRTLILVCLLACGDTNVVVVGPTDTGDAGRADADAGHGSHVIVDVGEGDADAGEAEDAGVQGCSSFVDQTLKNPTIVWTRPVGKTCYRIAKGQSVTWSPTEGFDIHPLFPFEGTSPNPIEEQQGAGTAPYTVFFTTTGTFGFVCRYHPSMRGAIEVVEP